MTVRRSVLSLFSGCGGLDLGFVQAGFHIRVAYDDWKPAVDTYNSNSALLGSRALKQDLSLGAGGGILEELPPCEVILGGPPCQGFSFAGKQFFDDIRNHLYKDFVRIVSRLQPRAFLLENVRGMEAMAIEDIVEAFSNVGYRVKVTMARATYFGVPQRRERFILVGLRKDLGVEFHPPNEAFGKLFGNNGSIAILDAIHDLPRPVELKSRAHSNEDESALISNSHFYLPLPENVQNFVRHIPNGGYYGDAPRMKLPKRLQIILGNPARYKSPRFFPKPDPVGPAQTVPADSNPSVGGVLAPDLVYRGKFAEAVDPERHTRNGIYTSPKPSRRFTPREAARLQTFPDEFKLTGSPTTQQKLIGNAVPVRLARAYAEQLIRQLVELDGQRKPLLRKK